MVVDFGNQESDFFFVKAFFFQKFLLEGLTYLKFQASESPRVLGGCLKQNFKVFGLLLVIVARNDLRMIERWSLNYLYYLNKI